MYDKNKGRALEYMSEVEEETTKLLDLVTDIKSTAESYFLTDAMKLKLIIQSIQKAGY